MLSIQLISLQRIETFDAMPSKQSLNFQYVRTMNPFPIFEHATAHGCRYHNAL